MRQALLVVAVLGVALGFFYLIEAVRYPLGTAAQPGPGLYPLLVGVVLILSAVGMGREAFLRAPQGAVEWPAGKARPRVIAVGVSALGYSFLLPLLGHPLTAGLLALVVLQVMGARPWFLRVGVAVAIVLGSHYVFAVLLGVPLPAEVRLR